ncbi:MAG: helix-turn-helix domain-containing protein, partial [Acidimicrobiales bacterium]
METIEGRLEVVATACRMLAEAGDPVADIAARLGWSQRHLQRLFRDTTGVTMSAYRRQAQADRARSHLRDGVAVTEAVFATGCGSPRTFYD